MLEQVVRPSQKPQVVPTRRIVSVRELVEVEPAGVKWGKAGNLPNAVEVPAEEDPGGISFTVKKEKEYTLDYGKSTTQKVRVQNPDDPSQYVVEERLKRAVFTDKKPDTVPVYRVNPDGSEADTDRSVTYSPEGSSIETVTPEPGWRPDNVGSQASTNNLKPVRIVGQNYGLDWPKNNNEVIVSEKGPSS